MTSLGTLMSTFLTLRQDVRDAADFHPAELVRAADGAGGGGWG